MFVLNVILVLITAVVLVLGWYSIAKDTFFTDFFEFYLEKNSRSAVVLQTMHTVLLLILFAFAPTFTAMFGSAILLTIFLVLSVLMIIGCGVSFLKEQKG
jgi:hypothetical protein